MVEMNFEIADKNNKMKSIKQLEKEYVKRRAKLDKGKKNANAGQYREDFKHHTEDQVLIECVLRGWTRKKLNEIR